MTIFPAEDDTLGRFIGLEIQRKFVNLPCCLVMMKKELQKPMKDLIEESYVTPEELAKVLDQGIEMLFYVEEGTFSRTDIQNVAAALRSICGILRG